MLDSQKFTNKQLESSKIVERLTGKFIGTEYHDDLARLSYALKRDLQIYKEAISTKVEFNIWNLEELQICTNSQSLVSDAAKELNETLLSISKIEFCEELSSWDLIKDPCRNVSNNRLALLRQKFPPRDSHLQNKVSDPSIELYEAICELQQKIPNYS